MRRRGNQNSGWSRVLGMFTHVFSCAKGRRVAAGTMELGLGIHGEPGARMAPLQPVNGIVEEVDLALEPCPHGALCSSLVFACNGPSVQRHSSGHPDSHLVNQCDLCLPWCRVGTRVINAPT